jgi:hypothetical protein
MIIWRETTKRFLTTFVILQVLLTLLYVFIDFFEKSTRCGDATMLQIVAYLGLNCLPLAVETTTQSLWLAAVLMVKEFDQSREWESYQLVNISIWSRMMPVCVVAISVAAAAAYLNESVAGTWKIDALAYKREFLQKKNTDQKSWQHPQHMLFCEGSAEQITVKLERVGGGDFGAAFCRTKDSFYHCVTGSAPRKVESNITNQLRQKESIEHVTMAGWYQKYQELSAHHCWFQARRALQKVYEQGIRYLVCAAYPILAVLLYWNMVSRGASWWLLALIPYCTHEAIMPIFSWLGRRCDAGWLVFVPLLALSLIALI